MDPLTLMVLTGVGVGAWALRRSHAEHVRRLAGPTGYEEDADVAIHVATHEAQRRRHQWLSPVHLLYGMLQVEPVADAIRGSGADPDVVEDRVLAALDEHVSTVETGKEGGAMLAYARMIAEHGGRRPGCTDLWAALRWAPAGIALCDAAGVDRGDVLFRLFHGEVPSIGERLGGELDVVLRNDHYTTKEFVADVLEDVFALDREVAIAHMEATHEQGHIVVGRYRAADARAKVLEVRRRAKAEGFPLWVGVEPA